MERGFKGIWIPKEIWLDKTLTLEEKVMLVEIDSLDCGDGCFAQNAYFADFFDLSKNRVCAIIRSLKDKGYIVVNIIYKSGSKEVEKRSMRMVTVRESEKMHPMEELEPEKQPDKKEEEFPVFEEIWKQYPNKKGKASVSKKKKKELEKVGLPTLEYALQKYKEDVEKQRKRGFDLQYKHGSTWLNSGYQDYLPDENEIPKEKKEPEQMSMEDLWEEQGWQ